MAVGLDEDVLGDVGREFPITGEAEAPAGDAGVVPFEEFVGQVPPLVGRGARRSARMSSSVLASAPIQSSIAARSLASWNRTARAPIGNNFLHAAREFLIRLSSRSQGRLVSSGPMPSPFAAVVLAGLLAQAPAAVDPALAGAEARAARGDLSGAAGDYRRLLADGRGPRALVLYRLADLERRTGDHAAAAAHAVEAADLLQRDGDLANASEALNVAGMAETNLGRFDAALVRFEGAMALSRGRRLGAARRQVSNLGTVYFPLGRYDEAAAAFAHARALAEEHARRTGPQPARHRDGQRRGAAAAPGPLRRRLTRYRAMVGDGSPSRRAAGAGAGEPGALFRRLGDPHKALDVAAARAGFTAAGDAAGEAAVLTNRGIALALDLGRPAEAARSFGEALAVAQAAGVRREALLAQLYRGDALLRAGRPAAARPDFEAARALAATLETREEEWKALFGLGRVAAAGGDAAGARASFDRAIAVIDTLRERLAVPATRAEFFQDKREVYDARIAAGLGVDTPAITFALIEQSRARAWRDRMALAAVSLDAVQATLPAGTVLLAYWTGATQAAVVRVTRDAARVVPLTVDRALVTAFDRSLRRPDSAWTASADALGRALLPAGLLDEAAHLVVVPDGALGAVPFDALRVEGAPLVERIATSVLPTAALRQLAPPPADRGWRAPWARQLAAFGDPLPGPDAWQSAGSSPRLAASAVEVHAVAAALGGTHQLFLGAANQKRALADALATPPPVLHLATHAVADLAAGEESRLLFSPATADGPVASLFLREVYALPLTGVDLVVLSACETERGPDVRGEGVQGFSRGLLAAGACAVTTLWRVPDGPTAALMQHFYQGVQAGRPLDDALAAAKRAPGQAAFAHPLLGGLRADRAGRRAAAHLRWRDVAGAASRRWRLAALAAAGAPARRQDDIAPAGLFARGRPRRCRFDQSRSRHVSRMAQS
jgi:tetratricopeptide (TPR) repeat protein